MSDLLNGETAVVTAAASGNGRAIALAFAEHGADVVDRRLVVQGLTTEVYEADQGGTNRRNGPQSGPLTVEDTSSPCGDSTRPQ